MSKKIYLRKCEQYTISRSSDPIEINVEKLRKCNPPYQGTTNTELMEYLTDEVCDNYDWYEVNKAIYGKEEAYDLYGEEMYTENEYYDSRIKGSNEWIELGVPNEELTKTGGFEIYGDT